MAAKQSKAKPAPKKPEVNKGTLTLVVTLEGDPGRVIDLLLAIERVKGIAVAK